MLSLVARTKIGITLSSSPTSEENSDCGQWRKKLGSLITMFILSDALSLIFLSYLLLSLPLFSVKSPPFLRYSSSSSFTSTYLGSLALTFSNVDLSLQQTNSSRGLLHCGVNPKFDREKTPPLSVTHM